MQPKTKPAIAGRNHASSDLKLAGQVIIWPKQSGGRGEEECNPKQMGEGETNVGERERKLPLRISNFQGIV